MLDKLQSLYETATVYTGSVKVIAFGLLPFPVSCGNSYNYRL